jgi:ADP-dependent NAD(P)H-hydrate dehydratase / NAD(P)H-hydrate epimerase
MRIFTSSQVRDIDDYTIRFGGISSIELMERAALSFARLFMQHFPNSLKVYVFAGRGNNGGDALAIARILLQNNYIVKVFQISGNKLSDDCELNRKRLLDNYPGVLSDLSSETQMPELPENSVVVDGLFGSGLSRPVTGLDAETIRHINNSSASVVAIDIPSGMAGEDNSIFNKEHIILAEKTFTFQFPFLSFFFAENNIFTGEIEVLDIGLHPDAINNTPTKISTIELNDIQKIIRQREKYSHKGSYGHALLVGGSYGMMGAAVLAAKACVRGGAGLVTAHIPRLGYDIMQISVPEALISIDESDLIFTSIQDLSPYTAVGAGHGLACKQNSCRGIRHLLEECKVPLLLDADALNILSKNPDWMEKIPHGSILTPHPGEFDRLAGKSESMFIRYQKQLDMAERLKINIILKGAHTILVTDTGETWFNTTGNPGMATGGSGDVLTGLIVSLLAQSYSAVDAAKAGIFLHGLAGDLAIKEHGVQSLIASDISDFLGKAFLKLS